MQQLAMKYARQQVIYPDTHAEIEIHTFRSGEEEALKDALLPLTVHRYTDEELERDILTHAGVIPQGIFLAYLNGKPVGTATGYITPKTGKGTLHMVSALPEAKGRQLGRMLCGRVVGFLLDHGCQIIDLTTDDPRLPAIAIYLALGFLPVLEGPDMLERWALVLRNLGRDESAAFETLTAAAPTQVVKAATRP